MKSTALHVASLSGKLEMVDLLLEAGAEKELLTSQIPPCNFNIINSQLS